MSKNEEARQVTDAVTQTNVKVVAEAPAMGLANVYQTTAHSSGLMFHNAVNAQNQQFITSQATITRGILQIYNNNTMSNGIGLAKQLIELTNT